ncbi:hypothetical protein J6590_050370 [Homalodisca vitripennis]|nr:hypothetical protein J6590_050370 [Homalodisca vitripennis]
MGRVSDTFVSFTVHSVTSSHGVTLECNVLVESSESPGVTMSCKRESGAWLDSGMSTLHCRSVLQEIRVYQESIVRVEPSNVLMESSESPGVTMSCERESEGVEIRVYQESIVRVEPSNVLMESSESPGVTMSCERESEGVVGEWNEIRVYQESIVRVEQSSRDATTRTGRAGVLHTLDCTTTCHAAWHRAMPPKHRPGPAQGPSLQTGHALSLLQMFANHNISENFCITDPGFEPGFEYGIFAQNK